MPIDEVSHQRNAPLGRHVGKADQARMSNVVQVNEFPEVGVDRDKDPALDICAFEQCTVAWVGTDHVRFQNIMSLAAQPGR